MLLRLRQLVACLIFVVAAAPLAPVESFARDLEILPPCHALIPAFQGEAFVGVTGEAAPISGGDLQASGECGVAAFVPVDEADASFDLTGGQEERQLSIVTAEGLLEAATVRTNQPRNPDPETGRPRIKGATGSCPLPTSPDDYWPSDDCLRPGPTLHGLVANNGLNRGIEAQMVPDPTVFTWDPTSQDVIDFPYLAPLDRTVHFIANDSLLGDPGDFRWRYTDPADSLYEGDKFRAGMPRCRTLRSHRTPDKAQCVAPLYLPQLDPLNTPEAVYDPADVYAGQRYSASNAGVAHPSNESLFDSLCEWSIGAEIGNHYDDIYYRALVDETQKLYPFYIDPEGCGDYLASRGYPNEPDSSCMDNIETWQELFGRSAADAAFAELARRFAETRETCFLNGLGTVTHPVVRGDSLTARGLAGYAQIAVLGPWGASAAPFAELWQDWRTTPQGDSRERLVENLASCFDATAVNIQRNPGRRCDADDPAEALGVPVASKFSTLNAALTPEQESLLGCGPFHGKSCNTRVGLFNSHVGALTQSFVDAELEASAGHVWRTDGLAAGSPVQIDGSAGDLSDDALCLSASGRPDEGCHEIDDDGTPRLFISNRNSRYYGLTTFQVRLLFAPFFPNCSSWLGRTSPGVDCVERYAQPGTIGARDIGFGTIDEHGGFVPDPSHPNFVSQQQSVCPTEAYGGAADQVLPGCRRKWRNFQHETRIAQGVGDSQALEPLLNLYGSDEGGGDYDERTDPRSFDVTRDGDPDFAGFDARGAIGAANADSVHPALVFPTRRRAGNAESLEQVGACSYAEYRPADQTDELDAPGLGLPQCSGFERDAEGHVAAGQVIYPKGPGHPFTGQPWATEIAALSWNLMVMLVVDSAEFKSLWIPAPNEEESFPLTSREPLAFATFDPNAPENADRIAQIELIQTTLPDTPENREAVRALRAQMTPICSLITPARCGKIRELLSYTVRAPEGGPNGQRRWLWETGGEFHVSEAEGDLTDTQVVHVAGPRLPDAVQAPEPEPTLFSQSLEESVELEWPMLLVRSVPEPPRQALALASLGSLASLVARGQRRRRGVERRG